MIDDRCENDNGNKNTTRGPGRRTIVHCLPPTRADVSVTKRPPDRPTGWHAIQRAQAALLSVRDRPFIGGLARSKRRRSTTRVMTGAIYGVASFVVA